MFGKFSHSGLSSAEVIVKVIMLSIELSRIITLLFFVISDFGKVAV